MFTIDADYNITTHDLPAPAREDALSFSTQKGFSAATATWSMAQFVGLWNSFAGAPPFGNLRPVTKFMDRNTAVKRIWNALQDFTAATPAVTAATPAVESPEAEEPAKPAPAKAPKAPRKATVGAQSAAKAPREGTRKETVLALIGRNHGATLAEIMAATGWQAHSVRGFIATLGTKHGCKITSTKNASGERTYEGS